MSIADHRPKPYDLDDQNEVMRLLRESEGYLRTCKKHHHGTDFEGRQFAMEALASLWESLARGEITITITRV